MVAVQYCRSAWLTSESGNPVIPNTDVLAVICGDKMNEIILNIDAQLNKTIYIPSSMWDILCSSMMDNKIY